MRLGSHLSTAGGLHNALQAAADLGLSALALFVRPHLRWQARGLDEARAGQFVALRERLGIAPVVAHGSYLVNLAATGPLRGQSVGAVADELGRCQRLGIECLVYHPGAAADESAGLARVADALGEALDACPAPAGGGGTRVLLETTAGQGHCLGWRFEQLAEILHRLARPERTGVCLDTCHVFAAGYDLRTPETYEALWQRFHAVLGLETLHAIHLNDSKKPFASRLDRHEHIGAGQLGLEAFRLLVNDPRLAEVPLILETPKGKAPDGKDLDTVNAEKLRSLLAG